MSPHDTLNSIYRIKPEIQRGLSKLNILTAKDLLKHFPSYFVQASKTSSIKDTNPGNSTTLYGIVSRIKVRRTFRGHKPLTEAKLKDDTGTLTLMWLNQPYISKQLSEGLMLRVEGKISESTAGKRTIVNPRFEIIKNSIIPQGGHESLFEDNYNKDVLSAPVYPASKGVSSQWLEYHIKSLLSKGYHTLIPDPIPEKILSALKLPSLSTALIWMHAPKSQSDYEIAKKRFAFDEIFTIQLMNYRERIRAKQEVSEQIVINNKKVKDFISTLPFSLTKGQKNAIKSIYNDFEQGVPMTRLLEGDVGSGKTIIAGITAYGLLTSKQKSTSKKPQVIIMAPTEILATQHFDSFSKLFHHTPFQIGLITSSGCQKYPSKVWKTAPTSISRKQFLTWTSDGTLSLIIGTHSLIQKSVNFNNLAYVIIDEQHRFGVRARHNLSKKNTLLPHLLSMTATPIPRTLALTLYGDLDLTVLDELPPGRKPVITKLITPQKREEMYSEIRETLEKGQQCYVICPRIFEADPLKARALIAKNVIDEAQRLSKTDLKGYTIGILHGKMKPSEKEAIMKEFDEGHIQVLVATSVIEVGINVPNATRIIIEGAERFGLSQLHQLRGRVARSEKQAFCYLVSDTSNESSLQRLTIMERSTNGFELAEKDLQTRGAGELIGIKQSGLSDLAMESIKNIKMIEVARTEAKKLIESDYELASYPLLREKVDTFAHNVHLE